ncbi:MAG: AraC family transcriptional regulator [Pseudomonadota bacterium]
MRAPTLLHYPNAKPLTDSGVEMASPQLKIIVATSGTFTLAGRDRSAFAVGLRTRPLAVAYGRQVDCLEWSIPAWMAEPLLGLRASDLAYAVLDLCDLPRRPLRDALLLGDAGRVVQAGQELAAWTEGRGRADARLTREFSLRLEADPAASLSRVAAALGVGPRRLRQAVRHETGLSLGSMRRLMRQQAALALLAQPRPSLAEAAQEAGFADQSHMTRELKDLGGITPARLRSALLGEEKLSSVCFNTEDVASA